MIAEVISVNIGSSRDVEFNGRTVKTGIFKTPTTETQQVAGVHIGADVQADTNAHGGYDKAIYAYADEDYLWWAEQLGQELDPAFFGENLTVRGVDVSGARVGDRWSIGTAVLEVSEPRVPCFKLGIRTGISRFQQTFGKADRPGTYLRIIEPGELTVGDSITIEPTTASSVTVAEIAIAYNRNPQDAARFPDVPALSEAWQRWVSAAAETAADG